MNCVLNRVIYPMENTSSEAHCSVEPDVSVGTEVTSPEVSMDAPEDASQGESKKRRRRKKMIIEGTPVERRQTRQTASGDVVGGKYTEKLYSRIVNPPTGLRRVLFKPAKVVIDKKDKLLIDMAHPIHRRADRTRNAKPTEVLSRHPYGNKMMVSYIEPVDMAKYELSSTDKEQLADRDELMWLDKKDMDNEYLEEAWTAIRTQFRTIIPLDAMLRRLMTCDYDINRMLCEIEVEREERLPQPLVRPSKSMNADLLKAMNNIRATKSDDLKCKKILRQVQDKAMPEYFLGEIITHYTHMKAHGCVASPLTLCCCRETYTTDQVLVERVQCSNCTSYLWPHRKTHNRCALCTLYKRRNGHERRVQGRLDEREEGIVRCWREADEEQGKDITFHKAIELRKAKYLKEERKNKAYFEDEFAVDDEVKPFHGCPIANPKILDAQKGMTREFSTEDRQRLLKALVDYRCNFELISHKLKMPVFDVRAFCLRYGKQYHLSQLLIVPRNLRGPIPTIKELLLKKKRRRLLKMKQKKKPRGRPSDR